MADFGAVGMKNYKGTFLFKQRVQAIALLESLTKRSIETVSLFGVKAVSIPNPGFYLFAMLQPLISELKKMGIDEGGEFYEQMDPIPLMILTFVFPGLFKLLAGQIGDIIPG